MLVMYMLHASNSHKTHIRPIDGIVCAVWLLDACSIYIISILYPPIRINWGVQKKFFARSTREFKICTPHYEIRGAAPAVVYGYLAGFGCV